MAQQVQWGTITLILDNEAFEQGQYHFDRMGYDNLPEYLGYLVGYLSAPLASRETKHTTEVQSITAL